MKRALGSNYRPALGAKGFENKILGCYAAKKMCAKSLLSETATAGKSWPEESPYREELALLMESDGLHLADTKVRRAMKDGHENDWSELSWTRVKTQECHHEVRQEDDQRKSIVQGRNHCWVVENIGPTAKDADLRILIWEEVHRLHQLGILLEVERVKGHRSKKGRRRK